MCICTYDGVLQSRTVVVRNQLCACFEMGAVRKVSWSDGGGSWAITGSYLDKIRWKDILSELCLFEYYKRSTNQSSCASMCALCIKRKWGNPLLTKPNWLQDLWSGWASGWGRGRVGLHPNPTYRPLTPTSAHMFRVSLQTKQNRWGAHRGLRAVLGFVLLPKSRIVRVFNSVPK